MTNNNNSKINFSNLSAEQLAVIQQFAAANGIEMTIKQPKVKEIDHLNYTDDDHQIAICLANEKHQFNINDLTEEQQKESKRTGLCPHCLAILAEAEVIKQRMARTRKFADNRPSADKPGFQIRELVKAHVDELDKKTLKKLQDAEFCKTNFKLQYALLLDITGKAEDEIKVLRKDQKGHVRYSPQIYTINKRSYLMTNDLYSKNLTSIQEFFAKLG